MLVELRLLKRHDLVSVMAQMMRPKSELIKVTVYMDDEDMDNFVFALLPKKQASKYQKELQDLVSTLSNVFQNPETVKPQLHESYALLCL